MSEHQAPTPGWWWHDMGPRGRVIPHAVLVEEYDGVLCADVGTGQRPVRPGPWWLGPVAPYQPAAAPDLARDLLAEPDESKRCATTFCTRRAGHDGAHSDRCGTRWETAPQPAPASDGPFKIHSAWRFE